MYKTNFYMIIRRLLFLLFIVAVHIPAEAQVKNINITVRKAEDLNSKDVAPMFHSLNRSTTLWARPTRTATA